MCCDRGSSTETFMRKPLPYAHMGLICAREWFPHKGTAAAALKTETSLYL